MPAANPARSSTKSSGTGHRRERAIGRGSLLGDGVVPAPEHALRPRLARREVLRRNTAQLIAAGGIVPGVTGTRDLARHVVGGEGPWGAAALEVHAMSR